MLTHPSLASLRSHLEHIEERLGYHFSQPEFLISAFIHRSFANEYKELANLHNERLEFLGDSVLNLLVAEYLFRELPEMPEGKLSSARASLVSASACAHYLEHLQLEDYLLVGKGETVEGRGRASMLSDLFEAILGAIYLDGSLDGARHFFFATCASCIQELLQRPKQNWKALLQEYVQKGYAQTTKQCIPLYRILSESGPDHNRLFEIAVFVEENKLGQGQGASKKEAEQEAARVALHHLTTGHAEGVSTS